MNAITLFPEITSFHHSLLQVDDLHQIYIEQCGRPDGEPVLFLHGGPGSGCNPSQRRFFDPKAYRIILFDQRGCGRSTPAGETKKNTTQDLVADIEAIRNYLGIAHWHVFGGSWGSTLALSYAVAHANRVASLVLRGIFMSRPSELDWFLGEVKHFFPEAWQALLDYLPFDEQADILGAYEKRVFNASPEISIPAAIQWNAFESSIMSLLPRPSSTNEVDGQVELARARVQIHYIRNLCFVGDTDMLKQARVSLHHIPTWIIQGRYDMVCPPRTAWELAQAMPHAQYTVVPDAGHSAMELGITAALLQATEAIKHLNLIEK